jgi:hypothetical protein
MKQKEKINYYPFVELPDPKIRYLIRTLDNEPLAVLRFEDDGTPRIRYLRSITADEEIPIIQLMNEKRRLLFG